jgi:hypothetical protein
MYGDPVKKRKGKGEDGEKKRGGKEEEEEEEKEEEEEEEEEESVVVVNPPELISALQFCLTKRMFDIAPQPDDWEDEYAKKQKEIRGRFEGEKERKGRSICATSSDYLKEDIKPYKIPSSFVYAYGEEEGKGREERREEGKERGKVENIRGDYLDKKEREISETPDSEDDYFHLQFKEEDEEDSTNITPSTPYTRTKRYLPIPPPLPPPASPRVVACLLRNALSHRLSFPGSKSSFIPTPLSFRFSSSFSPSSSCSFSSLSSFSSYTHAHTLPPSSLSSSKVVASSFVRGACVLALGELGVKSCTPSVLKTLLMCLTDGNKVLILFLFILRCASVPPGHLVPLERLTI